jgi:hypothetical protein
MKESEYPTISSILLILATIILIWKRIQNTIGFSTIVFLYFVTAVFNSSCDLCIMNTYENLQIV